MLKKLFLLFSSLILTACSTTEFKNEEQLISNDFVSNQTIPKSLSSNYIKEKINFKEIESKENIFVAKDNQVHIFEVNPYGISISQLNKSNFKNLASLPQKHPTFVTASFLDFNLNNKLDDEETNFNKNDISFYDQKYLNKNLSATGIINMSYGITNSNIYLAKNLRDYSLYIDSFTNLNYSDNNVYKEYFSRLLFDNTYTQNRQLRIKSLGNQSSEKDHTNWLTAHSINLYQVLSPEMQKMARNDVIYVKNIIRPETYNNLSNAELPKVRNIFTYNEEHYYELQRYRDYGDSKAMLLRAFVVAQDGFIKHLNDDYIDMGSSYSAPRVISSTTTTT